MDNKKVSGGNGLNHKNVEDWYINRCILYSVFIADLLNISLTRTNFVSLFKGKNYPVINSIKEKFATYEFLKNRGSKEIDNYILRLMKAGYLMEIENHDSRHDILHITLKGKERMINIIQATNFFDIEQEPQFFKSTILNTKNKKYGLNHGEPWSKAEEKELTHGFESGKTIKELAALHGRTSGAIKARLKKLLLLIEES